jgi:hypothetical protein
MRTMGFALLAAVVAALLSSAASAADEKWTNIKGQIVLPGGPPAPEMINVTADKELCLKNGPIFKEEWVVNKKNNGLKNVFVWIEPAGAARGDPFPQNLINPKLLKPAKDTVEIDQPCCQFIPHALAAQAGQTLVIKNSAPKPHNAKYDTVNNGAQNPLLPPGGKHEIKNLKAEPSPILLTCSIHPWMSANIRVFDHPYFALTDEDGNFEIKGAPQGKFTLYLWKDTWIGGKAGAKGHQPPLDIKGAELDLGKIEWKKAQ